MPHDFKNLRILKSLEYKDPEILRILESSITNYHHSYHIFLGFADPKEVRILKICGINNDDLLFRILKSFGFQDPYILRI